MAFNLFQPAKNRNEAAMQQRMAAERQAQNQQPEQAVQTEQPVVQQTQPQPVTRTVQMPAVDRNSPTSGMDAISSMLTTPEQEEKMRRASVANQKILAIGDAIRHIGNIAHTVNYAPSQQFNSPVQEEQARYEKGKAVRDAANLKYYTYQQAKEAQEQKQRQWEHDYSLKVADAARKAGYTEAQIKNMQDRLAEQKANNEANRALREKLGTAQQKERERHNKVAEGQGASRIAIARQNANNQQAYRTWKMNGGGSGGGSGVAPLDTPNGRITPNGRNYSNQLLQMFDYAKSQGLVQETDVAKRLREMGFGKDQSDNVKRQMVMDLLRTNPSMGQYAQDRLGWSYSGGSSAPSIGWDDDEEEDDGLSIGW